MAFKDNFNLFPVIEAERLVLRQPRMEEAKLFMDITSDDEIHKYMGNNGEGRYKTLEEVEQFINAAHARFSANRSAFVWAIALKTNNHPIGYIECGNFVRGSMADVAYWLSRVFWNQGIMTEALKAVVGFEFEYVKLHRIQAVVAVENVASIKSLLNAGFQQEGILRQYTMGKEFRDVSMLSTLRNDYQGLPFTIHFEEAIKGKTRSELN